MAASKVPHRHSRALGTRYELQSVRLMVAPWKTIHGTWQTISHRLVASARVRTFSKEEDDYVEYDYMVVQVEERSTEDNPDSSYRSHLLIGSLVDEIHEKEIMARAGVEGLWCMNCFADDMYSNGSGGVGVPHWMMARYFSTIQRLPACGCCGGHFRAFVPDPTRDPFIAVPSHTLLFSSIQNHALQVQVQEALAPHGIVTARRFRSEDTAFTEEQKEAIVAAAMHPRRIQAILTASGFEGLLEAF